MTADNPADQAGQPAKGRRTATAQGTDIPDDPQELAEDIKQTREQVGQTVEALTNKLDPKVQLREKKAQLRETAERMKGRVSATTGEGMDALWTLIARLSKPRRTNPNA